MSEVIGATGNRYSVTFAVLRLKCLMAEYRRPQSGPILGHYKRVQALGRDKRHVSHSLRTLEARGLIVIRRTPGGQAHSVHHTAAGRKLAAEFA